VSASLILGHFLFFSFLFSSLFMPNTYASHYAFLNSHSILATPCYATTNDLPYRKRILIPLRTYNYQLFTLLLFWILSYPRFLAL